MKRLSPKQTRLLSCAVYLLPLLAGLLLLTLMLIPHIYFVYNGELHETMSSFKLVNNTWDVCKGLLDSNSDNPYAVFFSYIMTFFVILFWIMVALYALFAVVVALCSVRAFSKSPTDRLSNRAKRWMHLLCPNRICYGLFGLLPIFPSFFPHVLAHFYHTRLGLKMKVFFFGPPDHVWAILLVLLLELGFFLSLELQARSHVDMFRLYKKKPESPKIPENENQEDKSCSTEK